MYLLAEAIPAIRRLRIPINRDQMFMLMAAFNELMLAVEIYLAHNISGSLVGNEWIPVIFGPIAALILGIAGLVSLRRRTLAVWLAIPTLLSSIIVGLLGAYFHVFRAFQPFAEAGQQVTISLAVWAPPLLAPLTFALVGVIGLSAIWAESPVDSGSLVLLGGRRLQFPFSKTSGYFFLVSMGMLATLISSVLDHARTDFSNPWLWVPTAAGVLGTIAPLLMGLYRKLTRADIWTYMVIMAGIIAVGTLGAGLHVLSDLARGSTFIGERFIRGAPILAPLLFADIATLGLLVLMNPESGKETGAGEG